MPTANATFAIKTWEEETIEALQDGRKLTRCHVAYAYEGDIEGECTLEYLMYYSGEGQPTTFTGLEHISGTLDGKRGSFVLHHTGVEETCYSPLNQQVQPAPADTPRYRTRWHDRDTSSHLYSGERSGDLQ